MRTVRTVRYMTPIDSHSNATLMPPAPVLEPRRLPHTIRQSALARRPDAEPYRPAQADGLPAGAVPALRAGTAAANASLRIADPQDGFATQTHWTRALYWDFLSPDAQDDQSPVRRFVVTIARRVAIAFAVSGVLYVAAAGLAFPPR